MSDGTTLEVGILDWNLRDVYHRSPLAKGLVFRKARVTLRSARGAGGRGARWTLTFEGAFRTITINIVCPSKRGVRLPTTALQRI